MRTSSRSGIISSIGRSQLYHPPVSERDTSSPAVIGESGKYDSVTLSSSSVDDTSRFYKELVGRLSQEVRTTTTTGDIRALRQQVASGSYKPDASAIAARMLFLGEGL